MERRRLQAAQDLFGQGTRPGRVEDMLGVMRRAGLRAGSGVLAVCRRLRSGTATPA